MKIELITQAFAISVKEADRVARETTTLLNSLEVGMCLLHGASDFVHWRKLKEPIGFDSGSHFQKLLGVLERLRREEGAVASSSARPVHTTVAEKYVTALNVVTQNFSDHTGVTPQPHELEMYKYIVLGGTYPGAGVLTSLTNLLPLLYYSLAYTGERTLVRGALEEQLARDQLFPTGLRALFLSDQERLKNKYRLAIGWDRWL